jgi:hypothetical protein
MNQNSITTELLMSCTYCFALFAWSFPIMTLQLYFHSELFACKKITIIFKKILGGLKHKVPIVWKYTGTFQNFSLITSEFCNYHQLQIKIRTFTQHTLKY